VTLLPTSLVGSYPQPDWLIDGEALASHVPARVRARELHICFGYPAFVADHPPAYSFLSELAASPVDQISIETAQSNLDLGVLDTLAGKTVILGVIALDTAEVETPETVAARIRRALPHKDAAGLIAAPDCGMKYLPREAAFAKLEALVAGARRVRAAVAG
jgi:5-methyltetrahydropteroyltriglutamate--homocysteine methyltransferase